MNAVNGQPVGSPGVEEGVIELFNEFACVHVSIDRSPNSWGLRIEHVGAGVAITLDPLELASLASTDHATLSDLANPARITGD